MPTTDPPYRPNKKPASKAPAVSPFLGLATAVLGFSVSFLIDERFTLYGRNKCLFAASLLCQLVSIFFGMAVVVSRTLDFRISAAFLARLRQKKRGRTQIAIEESEKDWQSYIVLLLV